MLCNPIQTKKFNYFKIILNNQVSSSSEVVFDSVFSNNFEFEGSDPSMIKPSVLENL